MSSKTEDFSVGESQRQNSCFLIQKEWESGIKNRKGYAQKNKEVVDMGKFKEVINSWEAFVIEDILKKVDEDNREDIEMLIECLKDEGIIKE